MEIDWKRIAIEIGGLDHSGGELVTGTHGGRQALEILLGRENLRKSVDYFVDGRPGQFTVEQVLKIARPSAAMERCYEIFKTDTDWKRRCGAVFLLAHFADEEALPWIRDFLSDPEAVIRRNGLQVLCYVLYGCVSDRGIELAWELLRVANSDPDAGIRELASDIRLQLAKRAATP